MFHYTKVGLHTGPFILLDYFLWMRKFAKHPEKYPIEYRYKKVRKLLSRLARGYCTVYDVEGKENIPDEPCVFVPNHLAEYDPLSLITVLERPSTFVAKKELENTPFVGKIMKGIDVALIDRKDLKQSLRVMMSVEDDLKNKHDKNWIIFPEGTRNKDQMMNVKEFHHGTFRPAVKANVPIVPVALYGTFRPVRFFPQYKKYPIFIKFLEPIYPEQYKDMDTKQVAKLCQDKIEQAVTYELRKKDHMAMLKYNKRKYRFNNIK